MPNTIKQFNETLNTTSFNRFGFWKEYRDKITTYISACMEGKKYDNALIIGAGNLDDINLEILQKHFNKITLSDIDTQAMKIGVEKYDIDRDRIELVTTEYTGLANDDNWHNFVFKIFPLSKLKDIDKTFAGYKETIEKHKLEFSDQYDVIIICPIYTQLLLQQGFTFCQTLTHLKYPKTLDEYVRKSTLNLAGYAIDKFNMDLVNFLKDKGKVIAVSDIFETKTDEAFYQEVSTIYDDNKKMDDFHKKYNDTFGIGVGDFGLISLFELVEYKKHKWFEWSFNKTKIIYVKAVCCENNATSIKE